MQLYLHGGRLFVPELCFNAGCCIDLEEGSAELRKVSIKARRSIVRGPRILALPAYRLDCCDRCVDEFSDGFSFVF